MKQAVLDVTDPQAAHSAQDRKWREVGRSADFGEPYPVVPPADSPT